MQVHTSLQSLFSKNKLFPW